MALKQPLGTWFADMDGGSHVSELYETLRGSTWFEELVKCELVRLACIPAPSRLGTEASGYPPFHCVRQVLAVRMPNPSLKDGRLQLDVDFDLEGHGRWTGELSLFIYSQEALSTERAKGHWVAENMRRIKEGEYVLPSLGGPEGWRIEDGFPDRH